ncbi:MAG: LepB GTPase-activating domain-containing protein [Legionella sp.]
MVTYKGKRLERFKEKTAGKNKSSVDGFYHNVDDHSEEFFIKKPEDKLELFTELFAGLLIQEFIDRQLVESKYHTSLIKADLICFVDGSYGLIQPCVQFDELFHLIGTANAAKTDRSAGYEAVYGPSQYAQIINYNQQFGLSIALMYSLLFGAHSVHSANIVVIDHGSKGKQFARIDWGDAFRNYGHPKNNEHILYPYETSGWFNYKKLTKDYFLNYQKITGLFPAMAEKAGRLNKVAPPETLVDMVACALKKIPANFLDQESLNKLAHYTAINEFAACKFGVEGNVDGAARAIAAVLSDRINKTTQLTDLTMGVQLPPENMYSSAISVHSIRLMREEASFAEQLTRWHALFNHNEPCIINPELIKLSELIDRFNEYLADLAVQSDQLGVWQNMFTHNIFTPHCKGEHTQAIHGHAFIPQYKEGIVFNRLFRLNSAQGTARFAAFEQPMQAYSLAHPDSFWVVMTQLATAGTNVINILESSQKAQIEQMDEVVSDNTDRLRDALAEFNRLKLQLEAKCNGFDLHRPKPNNSESAFYHISDDTLAQFSGDQLVTVCLEELESLTLTELLGRILIDSTLWLKVERSLLSDVFNGRTDNFERKKERLYLLREGVNIANRDAEYYKKQCELTQTDLMHSKAKVEELTEAKDRMKRNIAQLEQRAHDIDAVNQQLRKEREAQDHACERNQEKLVEHQQQLAATTDEVRQLKLTLAEQFNKLQDLDAEMQTSESRLAVHQKEHELQQQEQRLQLEQLERERHELDQQVDALQEQLAQANEAYGEQNQEIEQLRAQIGGRNQQLRVVEQQLEQGTATNNDLLQQLDQLRAEIEVERDDMRALRQQLAQSMAVKKPDLDVIIARTAQMAGVELALRALDAKANSLQLRDELLAHAAALKLSAAVRGEIALYAKSDKADDEALIDFKSAIKEHLTTAEQELGQHRQKWKYVLANISLAVALVGVGYLLAAIVNKGVNGNFTFFSKTDSKEHLEQLDTAVTNTRGMAG